MILNRIIFQSQTDCDEHKNFPTPSKIAPSHSAFASVHTHLSVTSASQIEIHFLSWNETWKVFCVCLALKFFILYGKIFFEFYERENWENHRKESENFCESEKEIRTWTSEKSSLSHFKKIFIVNMQRRGTKKRL